MKKELRNRLRLRAQALSPEECKKSDYAILQQFFAMPAWKDAQTVFCFVSAAPEPDTLPILKAALREGKTLAVPLCIAKGVMEARIIRSLDELSPGKYGLLEPSANAPVLAPEAIGLAVIPCVGADAAGGRLGHGGGYYDRFLPRLACPTVCLSREVCRLEAAPADAHDVKVATVLFG